MCVGGHLQRTVAMQHSESRVLLTTVFWSTAGKRQTAMVPIGQLIRPLTHPLTHTSTLPATPTHHHHLRCTTTLVRCLALSYPASPAQNEPKPGKKKPLTARQPSYCTRSLARHIFITPRAGETRPLSCKPSIIKHQSATPHPHR